MTSENRIEANRRTAQTRPQRGGRKPGVMNKRKIELRDRIRRHEEVLVNRLLRIALHGETETNSLAAINSLLDRGYGKPVQSIEGTGTALAIQIVTNATIGSIAELPTGISEAAAIEGEKGE
jgi:hypothetical protein